MPALSSTQKSQTRFHLGYSSDEVPTGDRNNLEQAMNNILDSWTVTRIGDIITTCESSRTLTQLEVGTLIDDEKQVITGDLTRTTTASNRSTWSRRIRNYFLNVDELALILGVRNYRDPASIEYRDP